jgi:cytochrome c-type biogenesis protein CcmH/NrfF
MTRLHRLAAVFALLALLALVMAPAGAMAAPPRASFNHLESEVMCDVCGVPLNIANSPRADQQREELKQLIAQGKTEKQIKDILVAQYGPSILATPQDHGFQLATYLIPIAVILAAAVAVALAVPRWRRRRAVADAAAEARGEEAVPALSAADERRLDEELARYGA